MTKQVDVTKKVNLTAAVTTYEAARGKVSVQMVVRGMQLLRDEGGFEPAAKAFNDEKKKAFDHYRSKNDGANPSSTVMNAGSVVLKGLKIGLDMLSDLDKVPTFGELKKECSHWSWDKDAEIWVDDRIEGEGEGDGEGEGNGEGSGTVDNAQTVLLKRLTALVATGDTNTLAALSAACDQLESLNAPVAAPAPHKLPAYAGRTVETVDVDTALEKMAEIHDSTPEASEEPKPEEPTTEEPKPEPKTELEQAYAYVEAAKTDKRKQKTKKYAKAVQLIEAAEELMVA